MKIHIDINHPAHVHYFKNFIKIMEEKGHSFVVTNRDSKIINQLLDAYGIQHIIRNRRPEDKSKINRILYLIKTFQSVGKYLIYLISITLLTSTEF